jgi:acetylornithine/succinyldiaminopimelate/putrescine aminotransferase
MVTLTAGETVLRLVPPLTITREDSILAVQKISAALEKFALEI